MLRQEQFGIRTGGRQTVEITDRVETVVTGSGIRQGLCNVFIQHTSASLILCENADPSVRDDLNRFMARLVPDGDPLFAHDAEGPDDMPAHVRTILTQSSIVLPVRAGRCVLGTWQGIYLWEQRKQGHLRTVTVTVYGE